MNTLTHSCPPDQIGVRLDATNQDRLELVVEEMQTANPELTVDDCVDIIFTIGLISTFSCISVLPRLTKEQA